MRPVVVFRHNAAEGPGYCATFLEQRQIPWLLVRIDAGETVPADAQAFSGLVFMGGAMSVNDDLPWIAAELALIRAAGIAGIPVLGHCLGGQLMARAWGGAVTANPQRESGWWPVMPEAGDPARHWLGDWPGGEVFHWHGETFSLPPGAAPLLASTACRNQGFVLGPHLGLQCHVEMTPAMVMQWAELGRDELAAHRAVPTVQDAAAMTAGLPQRIAKLQSLADRLYGRWVEGLRR